MFKKLSLAVLLVALASPAFAGIPAGTVWEVRTTGADTNGGGYVPGSTGTDWSQQNAAQYSVTDGITAGTTTITSATAAFGTDVVGNIMYVAGGTGSVTAGWYQIVSRTNATTVVVDRSTGLTAGTGVTLKIGGALLTLGTVGSTYVSGNKIFVKAGTYGITTGLTFPASNGPIIIGYTTTRGDNGQATIQGTSGSGLTLVTLPNGGFMYNITVDCNSLATCTAIEMGNVNTGLYNCKAMNYSSYGVHNVSQSAAYTVMNTEVTNGTATTAVGIYLHQSNSNNPSVIVYNNYVHDGQGSGIDTTEADVSFNIVSNQSGANSDCYTGFNPTKWYGNIGYNCGRHGINFNGSRQEVILNNILVSNGGYGINAAFTSPAQPQWDGNAFFGNASGTRNNMDSVTTSSTSNNGVAPYTNTHDVILTGNPFVNSAGGNFALNTTGGQGGALRQTGLPSAWVGLSGTTGYPDFGPVQARVTATSGGSYTFGQ